MYKIIGADTKEYGPVSAELIRQWVAEGRANNETLVRPEGTTEWAALGTIPELAGSAGPAFEPAPQASPTGSTGIAPAPETLIHDYDLDIGRCVGNGWRLLTSNFGLIFGGVAIYLLIKVALWVLAKIPPIWIPITLGSLVISGPLVGGVYYFLLRAIRNQPAEVGDVFAGFKLAFGQLFLGYIVIALLTLVAALPGFLIMAFPVFKMMQHQTPDALMIVMTLVGLIIAIIPLIYFSTGWMFTLPLIIDKRLGFWLAMATSRKAVLMHWWSVFGLAIVTGLVTLAGALACGVGVFVSAPVAFAAIMYGYEDIFNGSRTTHA